MPRRSRAGCARGSRCRRGIWLDGQRARRDRLLDLVAGTIPLGGRRTLHHPALYMKPADRIAIVGPNGAGKSTLLGRLLAVAAVARQQLVWLPQEIDLPGLVGRATNQNMNGLLV